jgi:hypothetical protein
MSDTTFWKVKVGNSVCIRGYHDRGPIKKVARESHTVISFLDTGDPVSYEIFRCD